MPGRIILYVALAIFAAVWVVPGLLLFLNAFRTPADIAAHGLIALPERLTFAPWLRAWNEACVAGMCRGLAPNFFVSLQVVVPASLIATLLGALAGYALSLWRFRGANIVFGVMMVGIFLPPQVTLLPWAFLTSRLGLYGSPVALVLIYVMQGMAFSTLFCRNYYATIPIDIIRAARVDGAGFGRIFYRVVLPISGPVLAVSMIWQFTSLWNEYLFAAVFSSGDRQPITAALMSAGSGSGNAAVLIAALPPLLVFVLGGRYFVRGLNQAAVR